MSRPASVTPVYVLDATALAAYLGNEPGADVVTHALAQGSAISSINFAEVLAALAVYGAEPVEVVLELTARELLGAALVVEPFTLDDAIAKAEQHALRAPHFARADAAVDFGPLACDVLCARLGVLPIGHDRLIVTAPDFAARPTLASPGDAVDREIRLRAAPFRRPAESCRGLYAGSGAASLGEDVRAARRGV